MPDAMSDADKQEILGRLSQMLGSFVPHNKALGLLCENFTNDGNAWMRLPYAAHLAGNPETGVLHGGAIFSLLDAASGTAVFVKKWTPSPVATLDLRIDYMKAATPPRDVIARATCYKIGRAVAFVRAVAYHDDESDIIASAAGAFMLNQGPAMQPRQRT